MTEKTAWADLPNVKYIDMVFASVKKNPTTWDVAWDAACDAAMEVARDAVRDAVRDAACDSAWNVARDAACDSAWYAAVALIAWDNCAYLLEEKPENVKMLALLGNQAAVLLYPACIALESIKELEMV